MNSLVGEINQWFSQGKDSEMERAQREVDRLEDRKVVLESNKRDGLKRISNLNLALMNCENEERNLRNNLKLIVNSTEKDLIVRELKELGMKLENYQVSQLTRDIHSLVEQLDRCKLKVCFHLIRPATRSRWLEI